MGGQRKGKQKHSLSPEGGEKCISYNPANMRSLCMLYCTYIFCSMPNLKKSFAVGEPAQFQPSHKATADRQDGLIVGFPPSRCATTVGRRVLF